MNKGRKIMGFGLGIAVLVSSIGMAFAADGQLQASSDTAKPGMQRVEKWKVKGGIQKAAILSELVTDGTITAEQLKAVQEALRPARDPDEKAKMTKSTGSIKEKLDTLVTAGTITQAQEDAIVKAFDDARTKFEAQRQKKLEEVAAEKGITVDELKAQLKDRMKAGKHSPAQ